MAKKRKSKAPTPETVALVFDSPDKLPRLCVPLRRRVTPGDWVDVPAAEVKGWVHTGLYRQPRSGETRPTAGGA